MKITILGSGTSQGVPVIACDCVVCRSLDFRDQRLRVSVHVEYKGKSLVIDTGPDFRQQMLRHDIRQVDAVLYTHEHKDHTAGMDDLRTFQFKMPNDMPIYARNHVLEQLKREFAYIFVDKTQKYPGVLSVAPHIIENKLFEVEGIPILPIEVLHYKLPVFGFRIGDFTYITDANYIAPKELDKVRGTKVLVLDALQKEDHLSHYTLAQALEVMAEIKPEQGYLTHISHKMGLHREVERDLPSYVRLAYDGLQLQL
ncbi:MBL fold metallo-hydrolase [Eisenibacter elegans]|uniref:MBL fold metallo-hydrolase n=1 Tax=Eisenibacter elegans TaxID=997 RepID=UPI00047E85CD|nr:MBL fold metallo-hydrolase [Eisenibacter elegans]